MLDLIGRNKYVFIKDIKFLIDFICSSESVVSIRSIENLLVSRECEICELFVLSSIEEDSVELIGEFGEIEETIVFTLN